MREPVTSPRAPSLVKGVMRHKVLIMGVGVVIMALLEWHSEMISTVAKNSPAAHALFQRQPQAGFNASSSNNYSHQEGGGGGEIPGLHYMTEYWNYTDPPLRDHMPQGFHTWRASDLKICETSKGGPEGRRITCDIDPNCIKCIKDEYVKRVEAVNAGFDDEQNKAKRHKKIRKWFPNQSTIVLIATNSNFLHFALNFECASRARQFNVSDKLLIIATDSEAYNLASKRGMQVIQPSLYNIPEPLVSHFLDSMVAVTAAAADLTSMGYNVVIMDADVVWLRSPLWMLEHPKLWAMDMHFQVAPRWDAQGVANTGFIIAKATLKTRHFLRTLLRIAYLYFYARDDQVVWNTLLRHWTFAQLHWQTLPRQLNEHKGKPGGGRFVDLHTTNGSDGTGTWIDNGTFIVHAVSRHKEHKFNVTGNWFLQGKSQTCSAECDVGPKAKCSAL